MIKKQEGGDPDIKVDMRTIRDMIQDISKQKLP